MAWGRGLFEGTLGATPLLAAYKSTCVLTSRLYGAAASAAVRVAPESKLTRQSDSKFIISTIISHTRCRRDTTGFRLGVAERVAKSAPVPPVAETAALKTCYNNIACSCIS